MQIAFHGGKCCGIKTIYNMGHNPDEKVAAKKAVPYVCDNHDKDKYGRHVTSSNDVWYGAEELPKQTYSERLDEYLKFLARVRPSGMVEIALQYNSLYGAGQYPNQDKWHDVLLAKGFHLVSRFKNSNSSNTVSVYQLVMLNGVIQDSLIQEDEPVTVSSPDEDDDDDEVEFCCGASCGTRGCCCSCSNSS